MGRVYMYSLGYAKYKIQMNEEDLKIKQNDIKQNNKVIKTTCLQQCPSYIS